MSLSGAAQRLCRELSSVSVNAVDSGWHLLSVICNPSLSVSVGTYRVFLSGPAERLCEVSAGTVRTVVTVVTSLPGPAERLSVNAVGNMLTCTAACALRSATLQPATGAYIHHRTPK